jgi:hypothetical protein
MQLRSIYQLTEMKYTRNVKLLDKVVPLKSSGGDGR